MVPVWNWCGTCGPPTRWYRFSLNAFLVATGHGRYDASTVTDPDLRARLERIVAAQEQWGEPPMDQGYGPCGPNVHPHPRVMAGIGINVSE